MGVSIRYGDDVRISIEVCRGGPGRRGNAVGAAPAIVTCRNAVGKSIRSLRSPAERVYAVRGAVGVGILILREIPIGVRREVSIAGSCIPPKAALVYTTLLSL
jgi:hypothetical protein